MELAYAARTEHQAFSEGLRQIQSPVLKSHPGEHLPVCVEDVIITSEFQSRIPRLENPAVELAALKYMMNFLSTGPFIVLNQLATVLVQVLDAGSAGVTLEERRYKTDTLQCVGAAGQLASEQLNSVSK